MTLANFVELEKARGNWWKDLDGTIYMSITIPACMRGAPRIHIPREAIEQ